MYLGCVFASVSLLVSVCRSALCNNAGLYYGIYYNTQPRTTDRYMSNYDPTYMKPVAAGGQGSRNLLYNGTTTTFGKIDRYSCDPSKKSSYYGSPAVADCAHFSINHVGLIYATISGVYSIVAIDVDDVLIVWIGSSAENNTWNRGNAIMETSFARNVPTQTGTQDGQNATWFWMNAGDYMPFRAIFANADGGVSQWMNILDPLGNVILGANTPANENVIRYSCDGTHRALPITGCSC